MRPGGPTHHTNPPEAEAGTGAPILLPQNVSPTLAGHQLPLGCLRGQLGLRGPLRSIGQAAGALAARGVQPNAPVGGELQAPGLAA